MEKNSANKCPLNNLNELLCLLNLWYCDGVFWSVLDGGRSEFYTARLLFDVSKHYSEKLSVNGMNLKKSYIFKKEFNRLFTKMFTLTCFSFI